MPQFDTFSFFSQITWTFFFFCLIFLINSYSLFPVAAVVLKTRTLKSWTQSLVSDKKFAAGSPSIKSISHLGGLQAFLKWTSPKKPVKNMLFLKHFF
jgi:hypothetical protein